MLKKKNEELELMLLKAHSYVAAATNGYQHYSTVFADGTVCDNSGSGKENHTDTMPQDVAINSGNKRGSSVECGSDDDDDNHSLSFLWL